MPKCLFKSKIRVHSLKRILSFLTTEFKKTNLLPSVALLENSFLLPSEKESKKWKGIMELICFTEGGYYKNASVAKKEIAGYSQNTAASS